MEARHKMHEYAALYTQLFPGSNKESFDSFIRIIGINLAERIVSQAQEITSKVQQLKAKGIEL